MNWQSENRNKPETERRRIYPEVLYVSGNKSNIHLNRYCSDPNGDQKYNEQYTDVYKTNYNDEYLYRNRFKTKYKLIIPPYGYSSILSEPRNTPSQVSSESICSRSLNVETKYSVDAPSNSKIKVKANHNESNITKKYDIHTKVTLIDSSEQVSDVLHGRVPEKVCSDKTTYCRPVVNLYNQEFLYKTMEKNATLRRLVTELIIARQKEKEKQNWNNYINELKKKHSKNPNVKPLSSLKYKSDALGTASTLEDVCNTNFTCKDSNPCQNLLQDLYKPDYIEAPCHDYHRYSKDYTRRSSDCHPFKTNPFCYPTSSQGRLIMLERERMKRLTNRRYKPLFNTINEEKRLEAEGVRNRKRFGMDKNCVISNSRSTNTIFICTSTQTELQILPSESVEVIMTKGCNTENIEYERKCTKEVRNQETTPESTYYTSSHLKSSSLVGIEKKLDNLIRSINSFIIEMKTKSGQYKHFDKRIKFDKRNVNYTRSDSCSMARKEKVVCGFIDDSSPSTINSSIDNFNRIQTIDENLTKINNILLEEIEKNKRITLKGSTLGETYHPCSVQISVTIPTKEISTEVTRSLSKAGNLECRNVIVEEIPRREDKRIAIAINTDPLSLLAMLRVSTEETIRRLLSYVPSIDYYSYLSRLQGPAPRVIESQYVCNICGATFTKPSALTDHIQKHELVKTRDCCVCRHVLDLPRRRAVLFKCQYCGQRFTRAYCCELHQEACAKRLGKLHDVTSSLMLLK